MGLLGPTVQQLDAVEAVRRVREPARGPTGTASVRDSAPARSKALRTWRTTVAWSMLPAAATTRCVGS